MPDIIPGGGNGSGGGGGPGPDGDKVGGDLAGLGVAHGAGGVDDLHELAKSVDVAVLALDILAITVLGLGDVGLLVVVGHLVAVRVDRVGLEVGILLNEKSCRRKPSCTESRQRGITYVLYIYFARNLGKALRPALWRHFTYVEGITVGVERQLVLGPGGGGHGHQSHEADLKQGSS